MENINPEQLNEWVDFLWGASWKILSVFFLLYYKDLVIHAGKSIIDVIVSWVKRNA